MVAVVFWPVVLALLCGGTWTLQVTRWPGWAFSSCFFFCCRCATTGHHASVHGGFWKNFWITCARCSYLEIWSIISLWPCNCRLLVLCLGVAVRSTVHWILREMTLPSAQRFVRQWIHVELPLLDEFPTISTSTWTRNLRCFFSVLTQMEKCAQSMPQVIAHACAVRTQIRNSYELPVAGHHTGDELN